MPSAILPDRGHRPQGVGHDELGRRPVLRLLDQGGSSATLHRLPNKGMPVAAPAGESDKQLAGLQGARIEGDPA